MMLIITSSEFTSFSPPTQAEILARFSLFESSASPQSLQTLPGTLDFEAFDMSKVVDLTPKQVETWMEAAQDKTKLGLRVIAEHGPIVEAVKLQDAGIENIPHFQSRTTIRTRTVTGKKGVFLLGWDESWEWDDNEKVVSGRYAVTPATHKSLRKYFGL